jgi:hypothetical protein
LECSPIKEEKKSPEPGEGKEDEEEMGGDKKQDTAAKTEKKAAAMYPSSASSSNSNITLEAFPKMDTYNPEHDSPPPEELQQRDSSEIDIKLEELNEMRASPGLLLSVDEDGNVEAMPQGDSDDAESEEDQHRYVDDIPMSPIAYDREDPISLMDLPDNLLSLPISPCGPNDDPTVGCFKCY